MTQRVLVALRLQRSTGRELLSAPFVHCLPVSSGYVQLSITQAAKPTQCLLARRWSPSVPRASCLFLLHDASSQRA